MKYIQINNSFVAKKSSYDRFAKLQSDIAMAKEDKIQIVFEIENRLGYTFVFLISTLPCLAKKYNKSIKIYCNLKTFRLLKKVGFLDEALLYDENTNYSDYLLRSTGLIEKDEDIFKIVTDITKEAPVKMSSDLSDLFISKAGEMYNNAKEHSNGAVIGAKFFKNQKNVYCFSSYDTGVGIPAKVLETQKNIYTQVDAFKWAMVDGNSTVAGKIPRGLGVGLLKSFVRANDGAIRICSGKVLYTYSKKNGEKYHELNYEFHGTPFEMDIIADNGRKYILR